MTTLPLTPPTLWRHKDRNSISLQCQLRAVAHQRKNIGSINSVVEEVMQQSADRQDKMLEIQQQCLQYKQLKEDRKRKAETN